MTLPTNLTTASTGRINHHETLHAFIGQGLPTGLVSGQSGHISWHQTINPLAGLPSPDGPWSPETEVAWHNAIHEWYNAQQGEETVGPRGTVGPSAAVVAPSGAVQINPGATTIQNAISANGTGTVFRCLNGNYNLTSRCEPKTGQQFWFDNGATVTKGTGSHTQAFFDVGGRNNVKIMNATISGFSDRAISNTSSSGWEIAHCDIQSGVYAISHKNNAWVHHNHFHDTSDGPVHGFQAQNAVIEDNRFGPNVGGGNGLKWVGTRLMTIRHNWSHGNGRTGIWMDFANYDFILEWNLVEDCGENGMWIEANGSTQNGAIAYGPFQNIVRHNLVRNNNKSGIFIAGSTDTEVHDNEIEFNLVSPGGAFCAEVQMYVNKEHTDPHGQVSACAPGGAQGSDLKNNWVHDNIIRVAAGTPPEGGGKKAMALFADANEACRPTAYPHSDYIDNVKQNNSDFNTYFVPSSTTANHFWQWRTARNLSGWRTNYGQDLDSTIQVS